jgi:hypothetical protein
MIHTVHIDDTTAAGRRFMRDFKGVRKGIVFENPAESGKAPEGYMTSDDFWAVVKEDTKTFCEKNGIL